MNRTSQMRMFMSKQGQEPENEHNVSSKSKIRQSTTLMNAMTNLSIHLSVRHFKKKTIRKFKTI